MSWTDDRVDTLKRLWGEGLSASQIATQLGGVSRNAVIGKVHRLGLEGRVKKEGEGATDGIEASAEMPTESLTDAATSSADAVGEAVATAADAPAPSDEPAADADQPAGAPAEPANDPGTPAPDGEAGEDDVVVPVPRKLKLTQLTERTCKWPIGDPMHDDFHFCGHEADEGRPYCEYHSGLAFQPASERRRVR